MPIPLTASRWGSGPLLVCHPGGPGLHPDYLASLEALAEHRTVMVVHPRGVGRTPAAAESDDYGLDAYTADLSAWIDREARGEPVDLLGHSHGGIVAGLLAARRPRAVRRLVLMATPAYGGDEADTRAHEGYRARRDEPLVAAALDTLERHDRLPADGGALGRLVANLLPLWMGPDPHAVTRWQRRLAELPANPDALHHFNTRVHPVLTTELLGLREIRGPTLAVAGDLDSLAGPDHLHRLAALVPGARTVTLPGSGHMCHLDATEAVIRAVADFLLD
ncbi:alpha/beta fold hydrolase [Streptomyces sp. NPDC059853]|uniref:alpha/beta fold hydrolase n=1 Tax=Streptomyces sp. NPDC059853 TaxID=3346973 RepID=UPI0036475BDB